MGNCITISEALSLSRDSDDDDDNDDNAKKSRIVSSQKEAVRVRPHVVILRPRCYSSRYGW